MPSFLIKLPAILFLPLLFSCTLLGEDVSEILTNEEIIRRREATEILGTAILINGAVCPSNQSSAGHAVTTLLPTEIRNPYYFEKDINECSLVLMVIPCSVDASSHALLFYNLYRGVIRNCNFKEINAKIN